MSVNMIIVVILAFAFLGVGLYFIQKLVNIPLDIPTQCEVNPPTADYPVCIQKELNLNRGKQYNIAVSFYNNEGEDVSSSVIPEISCSESLEGDEMDLLSTSSGSSVPVGESGEYDLVVKIQKNTPKGMYPCTLKISETEKPFTIIVE